MSSSDENKTTVRRCFESATRSDYDAFGEILASDYVLHPEEVRGADGLQEMIEGYHRALSGLTVTIDQQFTDGDHVATRFTIRGTHDGDLMGVAPTGRDVAFTGITISRVQDGRLAEEWEITDTAGLLSQIGVLPGLVQS